MFARFDPHAFAMHRTSGKATTADGQLLYAWTGTHWRPISDDEGERDAYRWIVEHDRDYAGPDNARKAHKAAILWAPKLIAQTRDVVVPCLNGYVHMASGRPELRDPDRDLGLQHVLSCRYDPSQGAPTFHRFLETVLPDPEVRSRVQEYIGYTLTSDARFQRAQFWLGGGANGKGVLANIVQALHGATAAISLDALEGFRMSVLIGASLIYVDEVPRARINEQLLKSLIAGETVQVDRKYREPLSIQVRGKWLALGNHLPTITDHSMGFWRRWDIVPFDVTIPEERRDPMLASKIVENELPGVLNWALDGLARLQVRGAFDAAVPVAMAKALHAAKTETNSVQAWHEDCEIAKSPTCEASKDEVFMHYRGWCEQNGLAAMASPRFWTRLRELVEVNEERRRLGEKQVRMCDVQLPGIAAPKMGLVPVPPPKQLSLGGHRAR
jgi:putative DNA primase/helicase